DSNTIYKFKSEGIRSRPTTGSNWKIRYNTITNIQDAGIFAEGTGGAQYIGNRISAIKAGTGIVVNGPNALIANNYIQTEGLGISKGISLRSGGTGSSILFNSVNVTGIDIINGQALEVLGGNNYTIKNNIFANNGGGYAAYVTAPVTSFNLDYNDYYSTKRRVAFYQNTNYDTLSVFASATGKDANSKSVNPFYTSATNLQSNHTLLNETGTAIASVANDIDSTLRSATPDIGAKEFSPCANDAGVNEFWGFANPLPIGSNNVQVVLQNQGTNTLSTTTIHWQVNGVAQAPFVWTGSLSEKQNAIVNIGSYNFPAGKSFKLKAWTVDANGGADCNTYNDTTNVLDLGTPLCGVYTIGGVNPDFPTFYDASVALNNAGVACPVIFKVRNGSYNEQIKLYDIPGASLSNTVLFEGENGDSTLAEIHYQLSNPSNDFTISLTGADYITFQKMGIR
ncbi:MAG: right-handed parallel beta-helix repeat-containing protein, partial [Bacteroidota bacterium]